VEVPLVVILGAGASRGSANYARRLCPPLTVDLFDEEIYGDLLEMYDMAHQAGRFIGRERTGNSALALEHVLSELRTSEFVHHRQMAVAVPPYLQHLLHSVSDAHYRKAFRYDHLIERLLRLPYVYFVTLNYDVLLDRRLASHHPLRDLDDYIARGKKWSLIKLHGSVNWYRKTVERFRLASPPAFLSWNKEEFGCVAPDTPLDAIRGQSSAGLTRRYPALALPEGPDDQLVLPSQHLEFLKQGLSGAPQIDLLVLGYSGLDHQVLKLLSKRKSDVRRMTIVNSDYLAAVEVNDRLQGAGVRAVWPEMFDGDFAGWVDDGHLDRLVDEYGGPYRNAMTA
jgi:hypothetical protein